MAEVPLSRQRCRDAFAATIVASTSLANWHAKSPEPYPLHAHEAMAAIEEALRALQEARTLLAAEIRVNEDERAAAEDERAARLERLLDEANCRIADLEGEVPAS